MVTVGVMTLGSARPLAVVLVVIGASWIMWTFALKLLADHKTERFYQEMAKAMERGFELLREKPKADTDDYTARADAWASVCAAIIQSALGDAEVKRFMSSPRSSSNPSWGGTRATNAIQDRLARLTDIVGRSDLCASLNFAHRRGWFSPATPQSPQGSKHDP